MKNYALASLILLGGCATAPSTAETEREIVLQHVAVDVGTAGPFSKKAKRELDVLSDKDRVEASMLLDRGAVAFLVYPKTPGSASASTPKKETGPRVVLVQHGRVVGDFTAP
jgi:hypothetical protein